MGQRALENALTQLQDCQVTYAQQQRLLEEQQRTVDGLKAQTQIADNAAAACAANTGFGAVRQVQMQRTDTTEEDDENESCDDVDEEELGPEELALFAKLKQLEADKKMLEGALRMEQGDMATQMQDLQGLMATLGLSGKDVAT